MSSPPVKLSEAALAAATAPKTPVVWVYSGDDNILRGDIMGMAGVAENLAKKSGGAVFFVGKNNLIPDMPYIQADDAISFKAGAHQYGLPDIIMGIGSYSARANLKRPDIFCVSEAAEFLAHTYKVDRKEFLVPHHCTPERLRKSSEIFLDRFPLNGKTLVTCHLCSDSEISDENINRFSARLEQLDDAVVFILQYRRCSQERFDQFIDILKRNNKTATLIPYTNTASSVDYNPHPGILLPSSAHVVFGSSHSVLSEILATDRPLLTSCDLIRNHSWAVKEGRVIELKTMQDWSVLNQGPFTRYDITGEIATAILTAYEQHKADLPLKAPFHVRGIVPG